MSAFGSTPKTGLPFSSSMRVQIPVPEAISAITCCGRQSALRLQRLQCFRRISRPVADIVFDPIGKAAGSIGSRHKGTYVARFFTLPESHSNGRIEMLSLPAGAPGSPRRSHANKQREFEPATQPAQLCASSSKSAPVSLPPAGRSTSICCAAWSISSIFRKTNT